MNETLLINFGWLQANTDTETKQKRRRQFMENISVSVATDIIQFSLYVHRRVIILCFVLHFYFCFIFDSVFRIKEALNKTRQHIPRIRHFIHTSLRTANVSSMELRTYRRIIIQRDIAYLSVTLSVRSRGFKTAIACSNPD